MIRFGIAAIDVASSGNGFMTKYSLRVTLLVSVALVGLITARELLLQAQPLLRGRTAVTSRHVLVRSRRLQRRRRLLDLCIAPLLVAFTVLVIGRFAVLA